MEMVDLEIVLPNSLADRIQQHADSIGRTVPELVSLWLWDYEEQQRNRALAEFEIIGVDSGPSDQSDALESAPAWPPSD